MIDHGVDANGEKLVALPTDIPALDAFVASIIGEYALPPGDDTYDMIATMIMHLPQTKAFMPRSYFGYGVYKSMANKAAYTKLREFAQAREEKEMAEKKKEDDAKQHETLKLVPGETL